MLLSETQDPAQRLPLYLRLADAQQHKLVSYGAALDVVLDAVRKYPSRILALGPRRRTGAIGGPPDGPWAKCSAK